MARVWVIAALCSAAFGGTIVVPNSFVNTPGNTSSVGLPTTPVSGVFQQLYDAGQFAGVGPIDITEISLRAAPGTGAVDLALGNVSVFLSTSARFPNNNGPLMSTTFANNLGPDNTLVFSGANVTLTDAGCSGPGPCPFHLNFLLTTPFHYDPRNGNFLFELVVSGLGRIGTGQIDEAQFTFPPGGAVANVAAFGTGVTTGSFESKGIIVELTFTPEPASQTMLALGASALIWIGGKRRSGETRRS